jgi:hypothetical protein
MEDMEKKARHFAETAKSFIEQGQEVAPALILEVAGEPHITTLQMSGDEDKAFLEVAIPKAIKALKADTAYMVTDGWRKDPNDQGKRIGEVITVMGACPLGQIMAYIEYDRDAEGKPVFGETQVTTSGPNNVIYSRFFDGAFVEQRQEGRA